MELREFCLDKCTVGLSAIAECHNFVWYYSINYYFKFNLLVPFRVLNC